MWERDVNWAGATAWCTHGCLPPAERIRSRSEEILDTGKGLTHRGDCLRVGSGPGAARRFGPGLVGRPFPRRAGKPSGVDQPVPTARGGGPSAWPDPRPAESRRILARLSARDSTTCGLTSEQCRDHPECATPVAILLASPPCILHPDTRTPGHPDSRTAGTPHPRPLRATDRGTTPRGSRSRFTRALRVGDRRPGDERSVAVKWWRAAGTPEWVGGTTPPWIWLVSGWNCSSSTGSRVPGI